MDFEVQYKLDGFAYG